MTFQISHIKPNAWAPTFAGVFRSWARAAAAAAAERRDRIAAKAAFARWMTQVRGLDDMGLAKDDAELWRPSYDAPNRLGELGFAWSMFQGQVGSFDARSGRGRT